MKLVPLYGVLYNAWVLERHEDGDESMLILKDHRTA